MMMLISIFVLLAFGVLASKMHFFDVRVFNSLAPSNRSTTLSAVYRKHEQEKSRAYEERVREVEHGCFTPLVFSTSGGMGQAATIVYKRLANLLSIRRNIPYPTLMHAYQNICMGFVKSTVFRWSKLKFNKTPILL